MTTNVDTGQLGEFFRVSEAWKEAYAGAHAGVLVMRGAANPAHSAALQNAKERLEATLRARFSGKDRGALRENPALKAYAEHYARFDKTYHVQLQLESIILKGRPFPTSAALVEAMFMAEVDSMLLTAGHDLDAIAPSLQLDVARGTENYVLLRGVGQAPKRGDMMISDAQGIISSIVYGPDQRTQIRERTTNALFTVYGPAGISAGAIEIHLGEIQKNVQLIAPAARVELSKVYSAS